MENERKKKFQDYAPPEQKPSGGYNLNGVYYSRDGQRLAPALLGLIIQPLSVTRIIHPV